MARLWLVVCVAVVAFRFFCCANQKNTQSHPLEEQTEVLVQTPANLEEQVKVSLRRMELSASGRVERAAPNCSPVETPGGPQLHKIIETSDTKYNFLFKPQIGFNRLVLRMKVDAVYDFSSWSYSEKTVDLSSSKLGINWTQLTWIPVRIQYIKRQKTLGRDRHSLRVWAGDYVKDLVTSWWLSHRYVGFAVYAEGPIKVLLNCHSAPVRVLGQKEEKEVVSAPHQTVVIACLVVIGLLLTSVMAVTYRLYRRRSHALPEHSPPVPKLSNSLLTRRRDHRQDDDDHPYEEFSEDTLGRLRQKLCLKNVTDSLKDVKDCGGSGEASKAFGSSDETLQDSNMFRNSPGLSLQEEKEEAWRQNPGMGSPPENHYVEMHGIVSRTNSLSH